MRGAHSVRKRGRGKVIAFVIIIFVALAVAGTAVFCHVTGRDLASLLPTGAVESQEASEEPADERPADTTDAPEADAGASLEDIAAEGVYVNDRFGFSLAIPQGFELESMKPDDAGIVIVNDDLSMTAEAFGTNNAEGLDSDAILASIWNGSEDSIARAEPHRVIVYQYDGEYEYFYWIDVGAGSIDWLEIRYPLQDDNRAELDISQALMEGFAPGDLSVGH